MCDNAVMLDELDTAPCLLFWPLDFEYKQTTVGGVYKLGWDNEAKRLTLGENHLLVEKRPREPTDDEGGQGIDSRRGYQAVVWYLCLLEPFRPIVRCLNFR